ncbi:hypothetical protein [Nostocoides veronense]|uniref:Uncharacterized protein n=1 Tax=Nostocoides veronense TaxID=330836 RepID=A0ABN2M3V8_9MICO
MAEELAASAPDTLAEAAEQLYAVPLADFMATRTELVAAARAAKDRPLAAAIGKLRKPSVAAGVVNALVRARPDLVEQLLSVGAQLRAAQANLHGTAIAALRPARDQVIADVLGGAREVSEAGGAALTVAGENEIRETVIAALASAEAADAVTSGALTRAISYAGFGEVDLADAVVATTTGRLLRLIRTPEPAAEPASDQDEEPDTDLDTEPPTELDAEPATALDVEPDTAPTRELTTDLPPVNGRDHDQYQAVAEEIATDNAADPDAAIEAAATAYQDAAAEVTGAKATVREASQALDAAKARLADLKDQLATAEREIEQLFAADAAAREAVASAVRRRQAAAELLARREAEAEA